MNIITSDKNAILHDVDNQQVKVKLDNVTRYNSRVDKYLEKGTIRGDVAIYSVLEYGKYYIFDPRGLTENQRRALKSSPYNEEKFKLSHLVFPEVLGEELIKLAIDDPMYGELMEQKLANMAFNLVRVRHDFLINEICKEGVNYHPRQIISLTKKKSLEATQEEFAQTLTEMISRCVDGEDITYRGNTAFCEIGDVLLFADWKMWSKIEILLKNQLIGYPLPSQLLDIIPAKMLGRTAKKPIQPDASTPGEDIGKMLDDTDVSKQIGMAAMSRTAIKSDFAIDKIVKDNIEGDSLRVKIWKHVMAHVNLSAQNPLVGLKVNDLTF